jgi:ribosome-associated protein
MIRGRYLLINARSRCARGAGDGGVNIRSGWRQKRRDYPGRVDGEEQPTSGMLRINRGLAIPLSEIEVRATTSGGPGGQHANRTQSRIEVRFDVASSPSLAPRQRGRLLEQVGPVVRAGASESRSQARNRQVALERLAARLAAGLVVQPHRAPTQPTLGSRVRRLDSKRRQGQRKAERRRPDPEQ